MQIMPNSSSRRRPLAILAIVLEPHNPQTIMSGAFIYSPLQFLSRTGNRLVWLQDPDEYPNIGSFAEAYPDIRELGESRTRLFPPDQIQIINAYE